MRRHHATRIVALAILALGLVLVQFQGAWALHGSNNGKTSFKSKSSHGQALGHYKNGKASLHATAVTVPVAAPPTTIPVPATRARGPKLSSATTHGVAKKGRKSQSQGAGSSNGTITIKKDAVPDSTETFHFGGNLGRFKLHDESGLSFSDLEPGTYDVTELKTEGWKVDHIVCGDPTAGSFIEDQSRTVTIQLPPQGHTTCTFVSTRVPGSDTGDSTKGDKARDPFGSKGDKQGPKVKPLPLTGFRPDWFLFSAGMLLIAGGLLIKMEQDALATL
ncbi:MAG: hypothetical protein QOH90_235 [Actinomycetota bacterium]|nr:hypothetical protein [Actinomycetota bacterium]